MEESGTDDVSGLARMGLVMFMYITDENSSIKSQCVARIRDPSIRRKIKDVEDSEIGYLNSYDP
jgi:hypothetical protein